MPWEDTADEACKMKMAGCTKSDSTSGYPCVPCDILVQGGVLLNWQEKGTIVWDASHLMYQLMLQQCKQVTDASA